MYTILKTGVSFLSVRWSSSAYSPAAAFLNETQIVPPGCIIRLRAAHISVYMASLTACASKARSLCIGSFRRYIPWSNCLGNQPWVRSVGLLCRRARRAPRAGSTPGIWQSGFLLARWRPRFPPRLGRCAFLGCPGCTLLSVRLPWISLVRTCVSPPRAACGAFVAQLRPWALCRSASSVRLCPVPCSKGNRASSRGRRSPSIYGERPRCVSVGHLFDYALG